MIHIKNTHCTPRHNDKRPSGADSPELDDQLSMALVRKPQRETAQGDGMSWGRSHTQEVSQKSNKALELVPTCEGRRDEDVLLPLRTATV